MAVAEFHGRVMASELHVLVNVGPSFDHGRAHHLVQDVVAHLDELEAHWSRFIRSSDIGRLNHLSAEGATLAVHPTTITLLACMVEGYQSTAGRFDPSVLRSLIDGGYPDTRASLDLPACPGGITPDVQDVVIDPLTNTVTLPRGLVLDPGGVGKGLAADLAVSRLMAAGADGACVSIGGDMAMAGSPIDPSGWLVDVEDPMTDHGSVCSVSVSGGGVATSSVSSRRWTRDGLERHHQIDPYTGASSTTDLVAVTVFAPAGWMAEVHATAALAAGSIDAVPYLEGHGLSGIALTDHHTVLTTRDLAHIDLFTEAVAR